MKPESAIKLLAFVVFTVVPGIFVFNLLTSKDECDSAVMAYVNFIKTNNSTTAEAKAKEIRMTSTCTAMGKQAEVLVKTFQPVQ